MCDIMFMLKYLKPFQLAYILYILKIFILYLKNILSHGFVEMYIKDTAGANKIMPCALKMQ